MLKNINFSIETAPFSVNRECPEQLNNALRIATICLHPTHRITSILSDILLAELFWSGVTPFLAILATLDLDHILHRISSRFLDIAKRNRCRRRFLPAARKPLK